MVNRVKNPLSPFMERLQQLMDELISEKRAEVTQFAAMCKIPEPTMRDIMFRGTRTSIDNFKAICDGTGASARWLLWGSESRHGVGKGLEAVRRNYPKMSLDEFCQLINVDAVKYNGLVKGYLQMSEEEIVEICNRTHTDKRYFLSGAHDLKWHKENGQKAKKKS